MLPRQPSPISQAQLQSAMIATVRYGLRIVTAGMGIMFLFLAVCSFLLGFGEWAPWLAAIEIASASIVFGVRWILGRYRVPDRLVYPLAMVVAGLGLARCFGQLYVWGSPRDTMNLAVLIGATSLLSLSLVWSAVVVAVAWVGWLAIANFVHPGAEWIPYGFFLVWTTVLAGAVQIARQKLRSRLLQAEARYQVLVEHLPVITYLDDLRPGGGPIYISPQLERVLGYKPDQWQGSHAFWRDALYPPDRESALAFVRRHITDKIGWDHEYRMVTSDGRIVWIQDRATQIETAAGEHLSYGVLVDVTERKRAELIASGGNRVLKRIAAGVPLAEVLDVLIQACQEATLGTLGMVLLFDDDGDLRNHAAPHLPVGFTQPIATLLSDHARLPFGAVTEARQTLIIDDLAEDARWPEHRALAEQAGLRACWIEPIYSPGRQLLGVLAMYSRQTRISQVIDSQLIQSTASLAALAIERSRVEAHLARHREQLEQLVQDRTRQLETSLGQLRHAERLASVGTLAAGIAHEINNPVGMILLSAEQAMYVTADDERGANVKMLLRDIVSNAKRCGRIVKNVLRFARQEPAERWPDDINSVVQHAIELTQTYAARAGGLVETQLAVELPKVMLNPVELEQVFVNLICNGIESADESPSIMITTEEIGSTVRVVVRDNGRGVSRDDRSRIFDPFYTTRQAEGGTGLGLSLAYGIVTDHGGTIRVDGVPGGGTQMIVELPAHCVESSVVST